MSKVTRRELAAAVSVTALLAARPAPAQLVAAAAQPPVAQPPVAQNDELNAVRNQIQQIAGQLDKFPLPMDAEPATIFKP